MIGDAYVPVYNEASDAWYPCNRAAELLVHLNHIWSDITTLNHLRVDKSTDDVTERLLFKYIVIEFLSLLEPLKELQQIAIKSPRLIRGRPAPWRFITKRELIETKRLTKEFWRCFQPFQRELFEIRNEIGAHRRFSDLVSIQILWQRLKVEQYMAAMNNFLPLFEYFRELNIYEWSRSFGEQGGKIALSTFGTLLITPWEDAFDSENETI